MIYATRGLVETVLRLGEENDPESTTVPLAVTDAAELPESGLPPETPVFTHFYLPSKGDALNAVFGVELGIPAGQTPGVFISHPLRELKLTKEDDLREAVFIAVPPWDESSLKVFDRSGAVQELRILDVEPPEEAL